MLPYAAYLFLLFDLFELTFESLKAEVDCFFESVAGLGGEEFGSAGDVQFDLSLLIVGGFGLYHF